MTDGELISKAGNARAVLDSPAYMDAYNAVRQRLVDALLGVKMEETASAEIFRHSIKLLDALKG